jgi:hypothetical protein
MSETIDAVRGGAPCAKEILCLVAARVRARIEELKAEHAALYKHLMKEAMLDGFEAIGKEVEARRLSDLQTQRYHQCAAVLDDWKAFELAYDALRQSLIDPSVKG